MAPNKCPTHYAAIVISGKILTLGCSGLAGCSKICKHAVTRHAEMDAINKIKDKSRLRKSYNVERPMEENRWKICIG